jgi:predicted nucleotidyltransferase
MHRGCGKDQAVALNIQIDQQKLAAFADKWGINFLAIFDTHIREEEGEVTDVMYSALPGVKLPGSFGKLFAMEDELGAILGRRVAMDDRELVKTYSGSKHFQHYMETMQVIYDR